MAGGDDDAFVAGKEGFYMDGPWEGAQNIPVTNPSMASNFGVVAFPNTVGGPSTFGQGNYNIIPKGAAHPQQAFEFIAWLAGYNNETFNSQIDPKGGWMPASPSVVAAARLPDVAEGQPVAERVRPADVQPAVGHSQAHQDRVAVRDRRGDRHREHRRAQP